MESERKLPSYIKVDGFILPVAFYPPAFRDTLKYKARDDDVFLVTYPKCGTTWMQYILYLLYHRGNIPGSFKDLHTFSPHIEMMGVEAVDDMKRPGVIKSHLPFGLAPYSPTSKCIWVVRNPKDCCLSYYHHTECTGGMYDFEGGEFNDYFELFMKGEVDFGDYFDHVLSWYGRRNEENFLMVSYEEMKADIAAVIKRVASFLKEPCGYDLEKEDEIFNLILTNCSMKQMKADSDKFTRKQHTDATDHEDTMTPAMKHIFGILSTHKSFSNPRYRIIRKGLVGDARSVFTPEQNRRMDEKIESKFAGMELLSYWKNCGAL